MKETFDYMEIKPKIGRKFIEKCLKDRGYEIKQMPSQNPGYDIEAKKDIHSILIEVKAHLKSANIIEITMPEIKKSEDPNWELWNVEYLEHNNPQPVKITRFKETTEKSLDPRIFRLDLKECSPIKDDLK